MFFLYLEELAPVKMCTLWQEPRTGVMVMETRWTGYADRNRALSGGPASFLVRFSGRDRGTLWSAFSEIPRTFRGLEELESRADSDMKVSFSLYPTSIHELFDVADQGLLMPPKSTWFEPKLRSGLFIHEI